jgi:hypothetical protein
MVLRWLALFLCLALLCGCERRQNDARHAESGGSESVPEWRSTLRVITDANYIRSAEEAALRRKRPLSYGQSLVRDINDFVYVAEEDVARLQSEKVYLLPRLTQVLTNPASSSRAKQNAAELLFVLGDESGISYFIDLLESASPREQANGLAFLPLENPEIIVSHPRLPGILLNLLDSDDPRVRAGAIRVCGCLALPGWVERFARLLAQPGAFEKGSLCLWLSRHAPTSDYLTLTGDYLLSPQRQEENTWICQALEDYLKLTDSALRGKAVDIVREYLARARHPADAPYQYARMLRLLAQNGEAKDAPFLLEQIRDEKYKPCITDDIVISLARLFGDDADSHLYGLLTDEKLAGYAAAALGSLRRGTADRSAVEQLQSCAAATKSARRRERIAHALLDIGGEEALQGAQAITSQLPQEGRRELLWRIQGIDIEAFVRFLNTTGPGKQIDPARVREHLRESWWDTPVPPTVLLSEVLSASGIYLIFDAETDELPCRHDELISQFSAASMGAFHTQWTNEIWHQKDSNDYDADYTVQFLFQDRLYEFTAQNLGDWYDVTSVVDAINQALSDAHLRQRFFALHSEGQDASFVFCTPEFAEELRQKYYFAFDADLERAMKEGKDFERKVKEHLQEID